MEMYTGVFQGKVLNTATSFDNFDAEAFELCAMIQTRPRTIICETEDTDKFASAHMIAFHRYLQRLIPVA
jgi:hypothetical protein